MSVIKSFSVGNGDMFYIEHDSDNFTIIDCNLNKDWRSRIIEEIRRIGKGKGIMRFISTHPDEDHFHGIEYLDREFPIHNFYCVKNEAAKPKDSTSFDYYCALRDDIKKAFYIRKGCFRKWMNRSGDGRNSARIEILWPDENNEYFKEAIKIAKEGGKTNNISPIIQYSLENGVVALWFGDLESEFTEKISQEVCLPKADIIFAPHHGRSTGKLPKEWLDAIDPKLIVIGEADSKMLDYYVGYNTVTQNSAKDIVFHCLPGKVHVFVSNDNYKVKFLKNENKIGGIGEHYIGSFETHNRRIQNNGKYKELQI